MSTKVLTDTMTLKEVAKSLGVHYRTVMYWIKHGTMPFPYVKIGRQYRVWRQDFEDYKQRGQQ